MIITVTLNTAVDKTFTVPNFALDRVHRPTEGRIVAGGKGINVARVLHTLETDALIVGFAGGHNGSFVRDSLEREGLPYDLTTTAGESRVCVTVIDPEAGTQTEINENGPDIQPEELEALEESLLRHLDDAEGIVLSGSIPPGVPDSIYARWIRTAHERGKWAVLDSSGEPMAQGMEALPDVAKPNSREFAELTGNELLTTAEILEQARTYVSKGVGTMLISMGRSGALATDGKTEWQATPPEIDFVSAVGSGDAFVAGFLFGRHHGYDLADSLRISTAAGAANAMTFGAGFCSKECIMSLASQVQISHPGEE